MNEEKIYAPINAKQVEFKSGKSILKLGINVDSLIVFLKDHRNEKGYVNLGISERKAVGKHGETHTVWLDTWKPTYGARSSETAPPAQSSNNDDVPF